MKDTRAACRGDFTGPNLGGTVVPAGAIHSDRTGAGRGGSNLIPVPGAMLMTLTGERSDATSRGRDCEYPDRSQAHSQTRTHHDAGRLLAASTPQAPLPGGSDATSRRAISSRSA